MDNLTIQKFSQGAIIVSDTSPKAMIVVVQGTAGVYKNYKMANEVFVKSISSGSFHCEQTLFLNKEQEETLVALSDVMAFVVTRNNVKDFFAKYADVAFTIVESIYKRLDDATVLINKLQPKTDGGAASQKSTLFPEGHGSYTLPLMHGKSDIIVLNKAACPLCLCKFESHYILNSKLRQLGADPDGRVRYKDVEPLYYSIMTCPNCLYSAELTAFAEVPKRYADAINQKIAPYKLGTVIKAGNERDTFTVFAGFYLALLCAPAALESHEMTSAGLWLKISRLYEDCKDKKMHLYAVKQTLDAYNYIYANLRINEKQTQQVRFLIGEQYFKLGDYDAARQFFFMLKADKETPSTLKRQVELRLETIREIKKAAENA